MRLAPSRMSDSDSYHGGEASMGAEPLQTQERTGAMALQTEMLAYMKNDVGVCLRPTQQPQRLTRTIPSFWTVLMATCVDEGNPRQMRVRIYRNVSVHGRMPRVYAAVAATLRLGDVKSDALSLLT